MDSLTFPARPPLYRPVDDPRHGHTIVEAAGAGDPTLPRTTNQRIRTLLLLTVIGLCLAAFMVFEFYHPSAGAACDLTQTISCSALIKKGWATLLGVPIAVLGLAWFTVLFGMACRALVAPDPLYAAPLLFWACSGVAFAVYLVAVEVYLGVLCPVCTAVHGVLLAVLWVTWREFQTQHGALSPKAVPPLMARDVSRLAAREPLLPILAAAVVVTPLLAFNVPNHVPGEDARWTTEAKLALAQCLGSAHVRMYGSTYCGHCKHQKALLGPALPHVDVLDCEQQEAKPLCANATLAGYPTWVRYAANRTTELDRHLGMMPLTALATWAHCPLPPPPPSPPRPE